MKKLEICEVRTSSEVIIGMIYLATPRQFVLVNHLSSGADLGPLRTIRREHIEPEAFIQVIPRVVVQHIQMLKHE